MRITRAALHRFTVACAVAGAAVLSGVRAGAQGSRADGAPPVAVQSTAAGAQLTWQAVPGVSQFVVMRAREAGAPGMVVGTLPGSATSFVDRGFNAPAVYQVIVVTADGRRVSSGPITYAGPPAAGAPSSSSVPTSRAATAASTAAGATATALTRTGNARTAYHVTSPSGMAFDAATADLVVSDNGKVVRIVVPLANLSSGNVVRDQHMLTALDVALYPEASFAVVRTDLKFPDKGATVVADVTGTFNVHGVGKSTRIHYTATSDGTTTNITATFNADMVAHGIPQQSYMGITWNKDVSVSTTFSVR